MSNKRAQFVGSENIWEAAEKQLKDYLETEYQIGTAGDMGNPSVFAVSTFEFIPSVQSV
jgi:hypothetical protein